MLKRSTSFLTGLCVIGLGIAPLSGCEKTEEHPPAAPEAAPAPTPAPPPPAAPDPKAAAAAKAAEMQKQAKEARDKAQAEISEQVEALTTKLGELKNKMVGHSKKTNLKLKKLLNGAEAQVKNLGDEAKALGDSSEDKFVEGKERLQKALAVAAKSVEQVSSMLMDKKHK